MGILPMANEGQVTGETPVPQLRRHSDGCVLNATPQRHSGGASPEAQPGIQEQGEYACSHVPGVLLDSRFRGNDVEEGAPAPLGRFFALKARDKRAL